MMGIGKYIGDMFVAAIILLPIIYSLFIRWTP